MVIKALLIINIISFIMTLGRWAFVLGDIMVDPFEDTTIIRAIFRALGFVGCILGFLVGALIAFICFKVNERKEQNEDE